MDSAMPESKLVIHPTGIAGLDTILGGGLPRGSLVLLVGAAGTGKTTIEAQIAFAAARAGQRVVFVTALSEPSDKLLAHLSTFAFYDPAVIPDRLEVISLTALLPAGLEATAAQLIAQVRHRGADLLILDGFRSVQLAATTSLEARLFLYQVGSGLGIIGTTTLVTVEADAHNAAVEAESTGADVLLGLALTDRGAHPRRTIEPLKARGRAPLLGRHGLTIEAARATVYPRLEARVLLETRTGAPPPLDGTRASFGLPALDSLLGGGLTRGTPTMVIGSLGTGKTLLGLYFAVTGVTAGEPTVFLGFQEDEAELLLKAEAFALGETLRAATAPGGGLTLLRRPPIECDADILGHDLLAAADRVGARRVVIDSLPELERAVAETSGEARVPNYLAALIEALRLRGVTTLLIKENGSLSTAALSLALEPAALLVANVLWLQQVTYRDRLHRVLSVPKMRFSSYDATLREFTILAPDGLVVRGPFESESGLLASIARQQRGAVMQTDDGLSAG